MAERDDILWLEAAGQRLGLVPRLGAGIAAWEWRRADERLPIFRPWTGTSEDRYTLASFAMLPWSNRISGGGFSHEGRFHPMAPNREGEAYPIHGDGWLQRWAVERSGAAAACLTLASDRHGGNPYAYEAVQNFELVEGGMDQSVSVTHRGAEPLPYGLGLHPWFPRDRETHVRAQVGGVWLAGADPIPTGHSATLPPSWDLNTGAPMQGTLIDNGYTGWNGLARIEWPERRLALRMRLLPLDTPLGPVAPAFCLVYRPPEGPAFCFEPITQPIDAFHLEGRPGLVVLAAGQTLTMQVQWRLEALA